MQNAANYTAVFVTHKDAINMFMQSGEIVLQPQHVADLYEAYKQIDPLYHLNMRCPACVGEFLAKCHQYANA